MKEDNGLAALMNPGEAEDFFEINSLPAFDPLAIGSFNRTNALWLAEFSRLIYRQERDEIASRPPVFRTRDQILQPHGWREVAGIATLVNGPQVALLANVRLGCSALVFRGTLGLRDMITDTRLALRRWSGPGQVHEGFKKALDAGWPEISSWLHGTAGPVFVTGHSLGGALATMTAARCRADPGLGRLAGLYTFGSPRVGDTAFSASLDDVWHCRVVNGPDIIPQLPPAVPNPLLPFFRHTGQLHHLGRGGHLRVHPTGVDPFISLNPVAIAQEAQSSLADTFRMNLELPPCLASHAPVNYVAQLEHSDRPPV